MNTSPRRRPQGLTESPVSKKARQTWHRMSPDKIQSFETATVRGAILKV